MIDKTDVTDGEKTNEEDAGGGKGLTTATNMKGNLGDRITNALQKVEEKKRKRAQRKAQVYLLFFCWIKIVASLMALI